MSTTDPNGSQLDLSLSSLSISSQEDWDKSSSEIAMKQASPPSTPKRRLSSFAGEAAHAGSAIKKSEENTPGGTGRSGGRKLVDLLRKHAEDGTDLNLSDEDEIKLSEELSQWINTDVSPYERPEDFFRPFGAARDDSGILPKMSPEPNGRPRGASESVIKSKPQSKSS